MRDFRVADRESGDVAVAVAALGIVNTLTMSVVAPDERVVGQIVGLQIGYAIIASLALTLLVIAFGTLFYYLFFLSQP